MPAETDAGVTVFAVPVKSAEGTVNVNRVKMASGAPACDIEMNEVVVPSASVLGEAGGGVGCCWSHDVVRGGGEGDADGWCG